MKNPTIINKRPLVFTALALMLGIAISFFMVQNKVLFWILFAVGIFFTAAFFLFNKNKLIAFMLLFFVVGFASHYFQYNSSIENFDAEKEYYVNGKVAKITRGSYYDNIILKDLKVDGFAVRGRASLKVYDENPYETFDVIEFYGIIENKDISIFNSPARANYGNSIFYDVEIIGVIDVNKENLTFFEKLRKRMTAPMSSYMKEDNKGIAQSLLFGDLSSINREDLQAARTTGLGHIFAVSGLHIGFIVAGLMLLMKKLRLHRLLSTIILATILFVYCGITAFPPSAVRASIMAVVYLLSTAVYKKSDGLSSLAAASIVMLLISPRTLFSLSFIMSLSAVFGILLFFKPIYNFFIKKSSNKIRKFIGASFSLSLSANIFLLPISLNVFGFISLYFVLANLIALPIVTVAYSALFITGVLSIFWQGFGVLYYLGNAILELIRLITLGLSQLPFATISSSGMGLFTLAYVLSMILLSRFIILKKQQKLIGISAIVFVGLTLFIVF